VVWCGVVWCVEVKLPPKERGGEGKRGEERFLISTYEF
jgi:hypothetical protein